MDGQMNDYLNAFTDWINNGGTAATTAAAGGVIFLAVIAHVATRRVILPMAIRAVERTSIEWDDILFDRRLLSRVSWFAPVLVVYALLPHVLGLGAGWVDFFQRLTGAVVVGLFVASTTTLLSAANRLYETFPVARTRPIKGYVQILNIVVVLIGVVLVVAVLSKRSPLVFLSGLTAMTAVLLLIFRDTILSFVASIQVAQNDMVRIGDWVEMPQHDADGEVIDIALHTLKVQNWDKTITTVPMHALVNQSFKNWRGMEQSGGRRIKRAIHLDMSTIRFLSEEEVEGFRRFRPLRDYMQAKREELDAHAAEYRIESGELGDPRRLTNIGTFRAYVWHYLKEHPALATESMTFIVRQREPGPAGLPLEVYVFAGDTAWVNYEGIQSDIFDHLLAMVPEFGLRVFQQPSGWDVRALGGSGEDG